MGIFHLLKVKKTALMQVLFAPCTRTPVAIRCNKPVDNTVIRKVNLGSILDIGKGPWQLGHIETGA
jgi:hypothetical protein